MFRVSIALIIRRTSTVTAVFGTVHTVKYDLYQKLQLQFDVLLMMSAIDTRNV
jgi:hypothetical protein